METLRHIKVLENVPVLVRTSLNVPTEDGKVRNAFRLKEALPTIHFLQKHHARVILLSHITGKGTETLHPMYEALKPHVKNLSFSPEIVGKSVREKVRNMLPGEVILLENLRRDPREKQNDSEFAKELAHLGDVFVQDCFDVCHREHASVVGIPEYLPSYAGFLVEKEVQQLKKVLKPKRPALAIISGTKFSTKEPLITELLRTYDYVYVGGALGNDFLKAKGVKVGASLVSSEGTGGIEKLLSHKKLLIPTDALVAPPHETIQKARVSDLSDIEPYEAVLDAGPKTAHMLAALSQKMKTVLWNGPLGLYEQGFVSGTHTVAEGIAASKAHSVVGGGDTVGALEELGIQNDFSFISTGGGAMLDYLADGTLPGLTVLE